MTKVSRQLKVSMGSMMKLFDVFGVIMFMLLMYLLSKQIIEKMQRPSPW
jgi:putative ABC transport system permease protein